MALRMAVPAPPAQKTGAYHDQRDNRRFVAELAKGHGGALLDLGCHVGGFALHAARAGLDVVGVDRSKPALRAAASNAESNGLDDRVTWVEGDMFGPVDPLPEWASRTFGTVVFDPPKIAKHRKDVPRATQAMQRTTRALLSRLETTGFLVLCSCSQHLDANALGRVAAGAAAQSGVALARVATRGPGPDHPVAPGHLQGDYLRVSVYQRR